MPCSSWIWEHLEKAEDGSVQCKHCPRVLSFKGGNGTLVYHLEKVHHLHQAGKTSLTALTASDTANSNAMNMSCRDASGRNIRQSTIKQTSMESVIAASSSSSNQSSSPSLMSWIASASQRPCSSSRAQEVTKLLVNCVTKDFQPLSFCEDGSMRELLLYLEPNYQPPTHRTLKAHVKIQYEAKKMELLSHLRKIPDCAATCDVWTNTKMVSFFSIMIHYIDDDWNMHGGVNLASPKMQDRHIAENLSMLFDEACANADLRVFCCTHDTAANMNRALRQSQRTRFDIGCLAHILQLAIRDAITSCEDVKLILKRMKELVTIIRNSESLSRQLRLYRDQLLPDARSRELQVSNATRWNSEYTMVESFIALHPAIDFMLKTPEAASHATLKAHRDANGGSKIIFLPAEMRKAEDLLHLLQPLKLATNEWQAEKTVSISAVYPVLFAIIRKLKSTNGESLSAEGKQLRDALVQQLEFRFNLCDDEFLASGSLHMIASYLDPRFKKLSFAHDVVKTGVRQVILEEMTPLLLEVPQSSNTGEQPAKKSKMSNLALLLEGEISTASERTENAEVELIRYESEPVVSVDDCPLQWWKRKQEGFPNLARLARRYLQVQATSASSERLFSEFGMVYDTKRMSLDSSTAEQIVFLHHFHLQ